MADSSGNLVQHYAYSAFGKILSIEDQSGADVTQNPVIKTSYTYTNREYDAESGMYYYRARYYEPSIGRFIQEDSHQGALNLPLTKNNKYIYGINNPQKFTDPSGRFVVVAMVIGAVGAWAGGIGFAITGGGAAGSLTGVFLGSFLGGWVGERVGGNLAVMRGADYEDGALLGNQIGGTVGSLTGGLYGYFGKGIDMAVYSNIENYTLENWNLLTNNPWGFIKANPALVVSATLLIANEIYCNDGEEYKTGTGCVIK